MGVKVLKLLVFANHYRPIGLIAKVAPSMRQI